MAPADQAANNVVVVSRLHYINTLIQELGSTKTYEWISTDKRSVVNTHSIDITAKLAVGIKENQDRLRTLYGLPKLHKRPYEGDSIKKKQPNLFLGEIDLFFFDVIAL